ncbi:hypothetical protein CWO91_22345 [Bradyrhizobium genosp. SA-3]|uniref:hypothetical protein n=1 Tax=Bradyrhizobium genosp. SA-3 TaxID=508868 RepID=UPI00102A845C|nr:hypothetical protein [Bradyrhizobium genosp. SA-3]RZN08512.1 hypothetical protein CWO91_22345 [Bradyrhizobium genosp. SA-3]
MPDDANHTSRIDDEAAAIAKQTVHMRDILARSLVILKQAVPDTFLGRKTHEPFPCAPSSSPEQKR